MMDNPRSSSSTSHRQFIRPKSHTRISIYPPRKHLGAHLCCLVSLDNFDPIRQHSPISRIANSKNTPQQQLQTAYKQIQHRIFMYDSHLWIFPLCAKAIHSSHSHMMQIVWRGVSYEQLSRILPIAKCWVQFFVWWILLLLLLWACGRMRDLI